MSMPDLTLLDTVEALRAFALAMAQKAGALEAEIADLKARNADADDRIERLTSILKAFDRARFGRRSEKLGAPVIDDEQQAFVFDEIATGIAALEAQIAKGADPAGRLARLARAKPSPRI